MLSRKRKSKALGRCLLLLFMLSPALTAAEVSKVPAAWSKGALGKQAEELGSLWAEHGRGFRSRPRLVQQGDALPVILPPELIDPKDDSCFTLAVLSSPNVAFVLIFDGDRPSQGRSWPIPSAAGLAEVTRCGARKALLAGLTTKVHSRRGVLEFVGTSSKRPPPQASELLAGRDPGPSMPSPQVGRRPALAPLALRIANKLKSYKVAFANETDQSGLVVGSAGRGRTVVHLGAGCHRFALLAGGAHAPPSDIDAALYRLSTNEALVVDNETSGEASLAYCVGRGERFRIEFSGARPGSELVLLHARWQLPRGLPLNWGPVARAHLAQAVWTEGLPELEEEPIVSYLGVRGLTSLVVETDPTACYLVAVAPLRGELRRVRLTSETPRSLRVANSSGPQRGTSLSFCADGSDRVTLHIQAVGSGLAWIAGAWRQGRQDEP